MAHVTVRGYFWRGRDAVLLPMPLAARTHTHCLRMDAGLKLPSVTASHTDLTARALMQLAFAMATFARAYLLL